MKILHIASFVGNIGDNASHLGFKNLLAHCEKDVNISQLEMRKFYKNYQAQDRHHFDQNFIDHANTFDRVVIGGGGFFDYCIKDSQSGTTIDMCPTLLSGLKVPVWFTSVGCAPHQPVPQENKQKFRNFLDACLDNKIIKINVRNDGSVRALREDIGPHYADAVTEILDHGFFYQPLVSQSLPLRNYVAVNISQDQIKMQRRSGHVIDPENYYHNLALCLNEIIASTDKNLILVPHIYSDLAAINRLLGLMNDFEIRNRVSISPCIQHETGANFIFNLYRQADLIIGMRFHANVCGIAMARPTIGLQALDRVGYMFGHLGLENRTVLIEQDFSKNLLTLALDALKHPKSYAQTGSLEAQKKLTLSHYQNFF